MLSTLLTLNFTLALEYECPRPNCAVADDVDVNPLIKLWKWALIPLITSGKNPT